MPLRLSGPRLECDKLMPRVEVPRIRQGRLGNEYAGRYSGCAAGLEFAIDVTLGLSNSSRSVLVRTRRLEQVQRTLASLAKQ